MALVADVALTVAEPTEAILRRMVIEIKMGRGNPFLFSKCHQLV